MLVIVNKIQVPAEHRQMALMGFEKAMPGMKQFKGFLGMELWTAEDGNVLAVSRWESEAALAEYTNSELFKQHHGGIASGPGQSNAYEAKVLA